MAKKKEEKKVEEAQELTEETPVTPEATETVPEAEPEPKKKYGPIDYVEKAIQLLEAEKPCENYTTALKMLVGAQIFIKKEVG